MNLVTLLEERAREHPERIALVDRHRGDDRMVTYGELARRVRAGAEELASRGLGKGDVVLVFQPVSIELYEILLGSFHAGLRVMLADPTAGREFLGHCCRRLRPAAFFGSWKAQALRLVVAELRGIPLSICSEAWFPGARAWRTDGAGMAAAAMASDDAALVTFTSGSTGVPKAAVRNHGFLLAQHRALSKALAFVDGEVDLVTLPVFVLASLASGLTSVLATADASRPGFPDVAAAVGQCERFRVTRCAASPAVFEGFLAGDTGMPAFEKVFTGGAPVFPDLMRRLSEALPDAHIESVYGSTEAEPIAHFFARDADDETAALTRRGGGLCSGRPVAEIELRIIADQWGTPLDEAGPAVETGQVGEIIVCGEHVLEGYLDGLGDGETKIRGGGRIWHRTGDAGWLDAKGHLWLIGRCAEKMAAFPASNGLPLDALRYPFAVECALREIFPGIRMAALEWDGKRTLVVGRNCDETLAELIRAGAAPLGMEQVVFRQAIPLDRRHQAKVDYPELRKRLGG
jgi:acyl-CoA synthetase (AMP-forming)/AMP-acid ligase II